MSHFSLKMMFPLLVVLLVFVTGGVFFAATGLVTPLADAANATAAKAAADTVANASLASDSNAVVQAASPEELEAAVAGETLFKGNCAQCHAVQDVVVGPALAGLHERRPVSWLIPWIKNSSKVVASGDEYAVKLYNQYQKQQMPSFQLSDEEITAILTYIKVQSNAASGATSAVALN
ncbi:c-type cytochrome [Hymenobacter volaticus]|uniref:Cytochrome c n=1 Tax=Hymenobacter volaticus TaxID=2932254 RepID=A0ABY4G9W1_9BACT|nr:cytochrome c [Hymenobacter volaticus]UOQ67710.1 cytochrome c [Hymenobacter volaticus]